MALIDQFDVRDAREKKSLNFPNKTNLTLWLPTRIGSGTTLKDYAGSNDGTIGGTTSWNNDGDGRYSLNFNTSTDNSIHLSTGITTSFTAMCWFNADIVNSTKFFGSLLMGRTDGGSSDWTMAVKNSNVLIREFGTDVIGSTTIATNTWYHIAGIYNPGGTSFI